MTPGDNFGVDPIIKRGEELERRITDATLTEEEGVEYRSIKEYARIRLKHLAQFPLANTAQEEDAQYLADANDRTAHERLECIEKALLKVVETLGTQLGAVAIGALQTEVNQLLKR